MIAFCFLYVCTRRFRIVTRMVIIVWVVSRMVRIIPGWAVGRIVTRIVTIVNRMVTTFTKVVRIVRIFALTVVSDSHIVMTRIN